MPHRVSRPFQARRALLRHLAPRYQQASPVQKTLLLDSFVEWTGYSRKYAIALLNHGEHDQQTIHRHRLPQYGPAVQQALFLAWKATHYVCAKRLLPSLPSLVALLERQGYLRLTEEERRQQLAMSVSSAECFLRTQRKPHVYRLSTTTPGPCARTRSRCVSAAITQSDLEEREVIALLGLRLLLADPLLSDEELAGCWVWSGSQRAPRSLRSTRWAV